MDTEKKTQKKGVLFTSVSDWDLWLKAPHKDAVSLLLRNPYLYCWFTVSNILLQEENQIKSGDEQTINDVNLTVSNQSHCNSLK